MGFDGVGIVVANDESSRNFVVGSDSLHVRMWRTADDSHYYSFFSDLPHGSLDARVQVGGRNESVCFLPISAFPGFFQYGCIY